MATKKKAEKAARKGRAPADDGSLDTLAANPRNPRKPWASETRRQSFMQSLREFGDLSGIVFNVTTRQLVGGHKRVDEFKRDSDARKQVEHRFDPPLADGTVALGHVSLSSGVRFAYREVRWNRNKESAANLAANKWSAEWDLPAVADLLRDTQAGGFDPLVTGFELPEIEQLLNTEESMPGGSGGGGEVTSPFRANLEACQRPTHTVTVGQLWRCGNHRVACIDPVRNMHRVANLIEPDVAVLIAPDPWCLIEWNSERRALVIHPNPVAASACVSGWAAVYGEPAQVEGF